MTVLKRTIKSDVLAFICFIEKISRLNFSDQDYSRLLGEEGSRIPCDKDANYEMKLPAWANRVQLKK